MNWTIISQPKHWSSSWHEWEVLYLGAGTCGHALHSHGIFHLGRLGHVWPVQGYFHGCSACNGIGCNERQGIQASVCNHNIGGFGCFGDGNADTLP